jgi:hypothetical protein
MVSRVKKHTTQITYPMVLALILTCVGALLSPALAQNEGWELFFANEAGDTFYYYPDSISKLQNNVISLHAKGYSAKGSSTVSGFEQLLTIDCKRLFFKKVKSQFTRIDGSVYSEAQSQYWNPIVPGSSMQSLADRVCKMSSRHK